MKKVIKYLKIIILVISIFSYVYAADTITYISCGGYDGIPYDVPGLVRNIITIIEIIVPVFLIILGAIDFVKVIFGSKEDDLKQASKHFVTRCIAAACVFFVILLVRLLINMLGSNNDGLLECISCFTSDEGACSEYEVEKEDTSEEKAAADKAREELEAKREELRKEKEEEAGSSTIVGTKNIFIGDSRMVGMCRTVTGGGSSCQFSNGGAYTNGDDIYIAQGSMGYSWFESTAIPTVNSILSSNSSTTYNIISNMGVNYLLSDLNKYISKYSELSTGDWKGQNVIIVSVNPVDETKEKANGYSTKQSNIVKFNTQIKNSISSLSNFSYCDVYNSIINNFSTTDGLHYTSSTYKSIYNYMIACIGN